MTSLYRSAPSIRGAAYVGARVLFERERLALPTFRRVELLLNKGTADINSEDYYGQTPLSQAASNGHEAIVELLLATGSVEYNAHYRDNRELLSIAA